MIMFGMRKLNNIFLGNLQDCGAQLIETLESQGSCQEGVFFRIEVV
jgi:hypothetical protein